MGLVAKGKLNADVEANLRLEIAHCKPVWLVEERVVVPSACDAKKPTKPEDITQVEKKAIGVRLHPSIT